MSYSYWSDSETAALIELSNDPDLSLDEISENIGRSRRAVDSKLCLLRRTGIIPKIKRPPHRKYPINWSFFEKNSADLWYWLGFFAADGNVSNNNIQFRLGIRDYEHLVKIGSLVCTAPVKEVVRSGRDGGLAAHWSVGSMELAKLLADRYGLYPKKTFTIQFPNNLPEQFLWDYLRGVWDGDGSIEIVSGYTLKATLVSASKPFIERIHTILTDSNIDSTFYSTGNGRYWRILMYTKGCRLLAKKLYADPNCLCLLRKRDIALNFKNRTDYIFAHQLAKRIGITRQNVYLFRKKLDLPYAVEITGKYYYDEEHIPIWEQVVDLLRASRAKYGPTYQLEKFLQNPEYSTRFTRIMDEYRNASAKQVSC